MMFNSLDKKGRVFLRFNFIRFIENEQGKVFFFDM
jgi:hypothetical protein